MCYRKLLFCHRCKCAYNVVSYRCVDAPKLDTTDECIRACPLLKHYYERNVICCNCEVNIADNIKNNGTPWFMNDMFYYAFEQVTNHRGS